jgi:hypothetical protein
MSNPFEQFDDSSSNDPNPFEQFDEKENNPSAELYGSFLEPAATMVTGAIAKPLSDIAGLAATGYDAVTGNLDSDAEGFKRYVQNQLTYQPRTQSGQQAVNLLGKASDETIGRISRDAATQARQSSESMGLPRALGEGIGNALGEATSQAPNFFGVRGIAKLKGAPRAAAPPVTATPTLSAEEVIQQAGAKQSMGAASAPIDLTGITPELKQKIASTDPASLHTGALQRQVLAETLPLPEGESPIRLSSGQATRNEQQIADEYNMRDDPDTQQLIRGSISSQSKKLGQSMGEIQQRATPDIVGRTTIEHDQTAIDAIKSQDNGMILQNRGAYKELADANGGALPIDKGALGESIDSELGHEYLTDTASDNKVIRNIMADIRSPNPISFKSFENARTRLAEVIRGGSSDGAAARIVRNGLESMPLSEEASNLKGIADKARAGAKARFDWIDDNPAVEAAVNDNVPKNNGLHVIGAKSPQAGGFLDRFATGNTQNASAAYVDRLKQSVQNPDLHDAIEGATLNKLRESAGIDSLGEGTFKIAPFSKTVNKIGDKAPLLMKPQTLQNVNHLKGVADDIGWEGAASGKNRSNTGAMLARFGALPTAVPGIPSIGSSIAHVGAEHVLGNIPGGRYVHAAGDFLLRRRAKAKADAVQAAADQSVRDAKLKFAQDATAPGAGIDWRPPATPPIARATGGKVDNVDALVNRLMTRWKKAKRATDATTKPLLGVPDAAIVRALAVSQQHI